MAAKAVMPRPAKVDRVDLGPMKASLRPLAVMAARLSPQVAMVAIVMCARLGKAVTAARRQQPVATAATPLATEFLPAAMEGPAMLWVVAAAMAPTAADRLIWLVATAVSVARPHLQRARQALLKATGDLTPPAAVMAAMEGMAKGLVQAGPVGQEAVRRTAFPMVFLALTVRSAPTRRRRLIRDGGGRITVKSRTVPFHPVRSMIWT